MTIRGLAALLFLLPTTVAAQVSGRFYLERQTFAPGEPVFLYFEVTNSGTRTQNINQADPYNPICSGYKVSLSSDTPDAARSSCAPLGIAGDCLSSDLPLAPGKTHTERILLNYQHEVSSPRSYEVDAVRQVSFAPAGVDFFSAAKHIIEIHQVLRFWVDETSVPSDPAMQAWVDQLRSSDWSKRREAALTLASIAPTSEEDVLLTFPANPEFRPFAPLAFHGLNTSRSIAALADLLRNSEPGTYESMKSAEFLAETEDPQWFPLLLDTAQKNPKIGDYVQDAAESGGGRMIPFLLTLMRSSDSSTRANAVFALGYTGSRAAVPILLGLLKSSDLGLAQDALYALRRLTHRSSPGDWWNNPQSQYSRWSRWWNSQGTVYKPEQCGDVTTLP